MTTSKKALRRARNRGQRNMREGAKPGKQGDASSPEPKPKSELKGEPKPNTSCPVAPPMMMPAQASAQPAAPSATKQPKEVEPARSTSSSGKGSSSRPKSPAHDPVVELCLKTQNFIAEFKPKIARVHRLCATLEADEVPRKPTTEFKDLWLRTMMEVRDFGESIGETLHALDVAIGSVFRAGPEALNKARDDIDRVVLDHCKLQVRLEAALQNMAQAHGMDPVRDFMLPRASPPAAWMLEEAKRAGKDYE